MTELHSGSHGTKHFSTPSVVEVESQRATVTSGEGLQARMGEVHSSVQELHDLGQGINLSEPQFPNLQELDLLCFLDGRTFRDKANTSA